ncbi:MAG: class I SAM-dependent methyltransferase [Sedimentisphaerales bacterium]|nr:class I SAM-dependent methyltransferase [Sedimentisphaerales bacterium]
MKYYHGHDNLYQKLLARGQAGWDKGDYESFQMLPLIKQFLSESHLKPSQSCALDLGCGTGSLACFLAAQGFTVTGIDISTTAIQSAKEQARKRNLNIDFRAADLCYEHLPEKTFDLITDNHFLHCIVFPDERKAVLKNIRQALKPHGEFWMETMVNYPQMIPAKEWNLDEEGISWYPIPPDQKTEECIERDGQLWLPTRRIQPSDQIIINELHQAGFHIFWQETTPPKDEKDTGAFRAKCRPNQ